MAGDDTTDHWFHVSFMFVVLLQRHYKSNVNVIMQSVLNTCHNHVEDKFYKKKKKIKWSNFQLSKAHRNTTIVTKEYPRI